MKHFCGMNQEREVLVVGIVNGEDFKVLHQKIQGDFTSFDALLLHPSIDAICWMHPANENFFPTAFEVDGVLLSRSEKIIFDMLSDDLGTVVPKALIGSALKSFSNSISPIRQHIYNLRKKLSTLGYNITGVRGVGYKMTQDSKCEEPSD